MADPKLYNPPAKVELSAQGAIERDMGSAAALVQVSERMRLTSAVAPPPETWDAYAKKTEESAGVIAMMDLLIKDLDQEMTEAETEEKDSQADYDKTIADAKDKRMTDSKALTSKAAAKADLESDLQTARDDSASTAKELMATDKYISQLHAECDWLISEARIHAYPPSGEPMPQDPRRQWIWMWGPKDIHTHCLLGTRDVGPPCGGCALALASDHPVLRRQGGGAQRRDRFARQGQGCAERRRLLAAVSRVGRPWKS